MPSDSGADGFGNAVEPLICSVDHWPGATPFTGVAAKRVAFVSLARKVVVPCTKAARGPSVRFPPVICWPAELKKARLPTSLPPTGSQGGEPDADAVPARPTRPPRPTIAAVTRATEREATRLRDIFTVEDLSLRFGWRWKTGVALGGAGR